MQITVGQCKQFVSEIKYPTTKIKKVNAAQSAVYKRPSRKPAPNVGGSYPLSIIYLAVPGNALGTVKRPES